MKLEKHKNLREESGFYWREISEGTFKFDRRESEVINFESALVYFETLKNPEPKRGLVIWYQYGKIILSNVGISGCSIEGDNATRADRFLQRKHKSGRATKEVTERAGFWEPPFLGLHGRKERGTATVLC